MEIELGPGKRSYTLQKTIAFAYIPKPVTIVHSSKIDDLEPKKQILTVAHIYIYNYFYIYIYIYGFEICLTIYQVGSIVKTPTNNGDEVHEDRGILRGYLLSWAQQGVLLLNATLTVREGHKEARFMGAGENLRGVSEVPHTLGLF